MKKWYNYLTMPDIATNKKVRFDYEILDTVEAGIELAGHEVKSLRTKSVALDGTYVIIRGGEAFLSGRHHSSLPSRQHERRLRTGKTSPPFAFEKRNHRARRRRLEERPDHRALVNV